MADRINSKCRLVSSGVLSEAESVCLFCKNAPESCAHLCFLCPFAWRVWCGFLNWWGIQFSVPVSLSDFYHQWCSLVSGRFQKKTWIMLFFSIIWSLWLSRNELCFQNKSADIESLITIIFVRWSVRIKAIEETFPYTAADLHRNSSSIRFRTNPARDRKYIFWEKPPGDTLKWNICGSFLESSSTAEIGGVLRDSNGVIKGIFSCAATTKEAVMAELLAIKKALVLSFNSILLHGVDIIVESDSLVAINWCKSPDIRNLANGLKKVSFNFVNREGNCLADGLEIRKFVGIYDITSPNFKCLKNQKKSFKCPLLHV